MADDTKLQTEAQELETALNAADTTRRRLLEVLLHEAQALDEESEAAA